MKPWKWDLYGPQMLLQVQKNNNSRFNVIILIELLQGGHKIILYLHQRTQLLTFHFIALKQLLVTCD